MENNIVERIDTAEKSIPDLLTALPDNEFGRLCLEGFGHCEQVQARVLRQILQAASGTEYGQKYGFGTLGTTADFQSQVPVSEWPDYEAYGERMADGAENLLFPGKTQFFIVTSGTSAGQPKLIPESSQGALARQVTSKLRLALLTRHVNPAALQGCLLPLSNAMPMPPTRGGIACGFASGFALAQSTSKAPSVRMAYPLHINEVTDSASRDYLLMRLAMQHKDVTLVVGNNAGKFKMLASLADLQADQIIQDIETGTLSASLNIAPLLRERLQAGLAPDPARACELRNLKLQKGSLLPADYWPALDLLVFWLSASVGQYVKDLKPLVPENTRYFDAGYGASEAKFNIPYKPGVSSGILSIYSAFYEFIPKNGGPICLAHQLKDGETYEMLITTWSGLYRYNMRDFVKVEGFTGNTPNIVFLCKSSEILNISDEKIPASSVNSTLRTMAESLGIKVIQAQVFPDEETRKYFFYVEVSPETCSFDNTLFEARVQDALEDEFLIYSILCKQHKTLFPVKIIQMKPGWQSFLYQQAIHKTGSSTQVKLPVMIVKKPDSVWIK